MDKAATITVREALCSAMEEEMLRDDKVFVIGEEVAEYNGAYKVTQGLLAKFGARRVVDTPITEHAFAGLGVGAALAGLRPVVEFMTWNFAMQAIDHIINSAAKTLYMSGGTMRCPIVFRGPNSSAAQTAAQHSQCYASWYAHCPGLIVISPYDAADAKGLLKSAIRDDNPVVFLEHELLYGQSFPAVNDHESRGSHKSHESYGSHAEQTTSTDHVVPIGKAKICRAGSDVTVVAFSIMVGKALEAADKVKNDNISVEVIDLRTLRPLDLATILHSVKKTNRIVIAEEGWPFAGIGAEISALVMEHAFDYLDSPPVRVAAVDVPLPYAPNLEKLALPQADNIVQGIKSVLYRV